MPAPVTILWFKRDLRVADHPGLASVDGPVVPLYIVEPEAWSHPDASARQWRFVAESLQELREALANLGAPLVVRPGEAVAVLEAIRAEHTVARLVSHEETGLRWSWDRDRRVSAWAAGHSVVWDEYADSGVVRRLRSRDGWAARREAWLRHPVDVPPQRIAGLSIPPGEIPDARDLSLSFDSCPGRQRGGRAEAVRTLDTFLTERGERYPSDMSSPVTGEAGCSRLSAHLAWGTISVREAGQAAADRAEATRGTAWAKSMRSFRSRLAWRDHFTQKLEDFPDLDRRCLHRAFEGMRPRAADCTTAATRLGAWAEGRTGLPFLDACMRYATTTGWLNFRMRAMVQCVASYHLWIDWRDSGPVLARLWTDYAPGIHWAQSQMQSGTTGINQLRIYNPIKQGTDQDPAGLFTRRWVPELARLPAGVLQTPWRADRVPADYPAPIVDVGDAARCARDRVIAYRRSAGFADEAARIVARHGSRKGPRDRIAAPRRRRKDPRQPEFDV